MLSRLINKSYIYYILLVLLFYIFLLPQLGSSFIQTNAPDWVERSARFIDSIVEGNFAATFQKYHPGVTLMWLVGICIKAFGKYQDIFFGQRSALFEVEVYNQFAFLVKFVQGTVFVSLLILALKKIEKVLSNTIIPVAIGFFVVTTPIILSLVKAIAPDALLFIFMFLSITYFFSYLVKGSRKDLLITGLFLGLSVLTKLTGVILFPVFFVSLLIFNRKEIVKDMFYLFLILSLAFVTLFPAMWVSPINTLQIIFDGAITAPLEDYASPIISSNLASSPFIEKFLSYPIVFVYRATPIFLLLLLIGLFAFFFRLRACKKHNVLKLVAIAGIFALIYYFPVALSGKKIYKYVLPLFITGSYLASYGFFLILGKIKLVFLKAFFVLLVVTAQVYFVLSVAPDYLLFTNPAFGSVFSSTKVMAFKVETTGYKELADYLNSKNLSEEVVVSAYLPRSLGPFLNVRVEDIRSADKPNYILIPLHALSEFEYLLDSCYILDYSVIYKKMPYLFLYKNICLE